MKFFTKKNLIFGAVLLVLAITVSLITKFTIPITGKGYVSGGSIIVYYAAIFLNPIFGGIIGSVSALVTSLFVEPIYAPIAIIAGGIEGIVCGLVYMYANQLRTRIRKLAAMLVGGLSLSGIYFVVEIFVGDINLAAINFGFRLLQTAVCALAIMLIFPKLTTINEQN